MKKTLFILAYKLSHYGTTKNLLHKFGFWYVMRSLNQSIKRAKKTSDAYRMHRSIKSL